MNKKKSLLVGILLPLLTLLSLKPFWAAEAESSFLDEFETFDSTKWGCIGDPNGKWSAENGVLIMEGQDQRITSTKKFRYATFQTKISLLAQEDGVTYYYLGFVNRENWLAGKDCDSITLMSEDGMSFKLDVKKSGQKLARIPIDVTFFKGAWHTIEIVWTPSAIKVLIDEEVMAEYTDVENIPDTFLSAFIDECHLKKGKCLMQVDYVKVRGGEVKGEKAGRQERNP